MFASLPNGYTEFITLNTVLYCVILGYTVLYWVILCFNYSRVKDLRNREKSSNPLPFVRHKRKYYSKKVRKIVLTPTSIVIEFLEMWLGIFLCIVWSN